MYQQNFEGYQLSPFSGIGKPKPLKHKRQGYWSRRIDEDMGFDFNKYRDWDVQIQFYC